MAWTQSEVDQIRAAVLALATGARVVSVSYAPTGVSAARTISYGIAQLEELRSLLASAEQSLRTSTYRLGATNNGLQSGAGYGGFGRRGCP